MTQAPPAPDRRPTDVATPESAPTAESAPIAEPGAEPVAYDLGGLATLWLRDDDPRVRRAVARAMDPYPTTAAGVAVPDVELRVAPSPMPRAVEILGPAGDDTTSASDGTRMYFVANGLRCAVPDPWREPHAVFAYEPGFPVGRLFGPLVRPALQVAVHRAGGTSVHASAVDVDGGAVLVAGWSESGKTEIALGLVETGAAFMSDKWSSVGADGVVHAFPIGVGIRRWVVPATRILRARLPVAARLQFAAARLGEVVVAGAGVLDRHPAGELAGNVARRSVALAGRYGLRPSEIREAYDQRPDGGLAAPLAAIVLLTTVPAGRSPRIRPMRAARAAERLVRTAAYERRAFLAFGERAAYAFPGRRPWADAWIREERARLLELLGTAFLVEVETPFPADPRPIADLIRRFLA